MLKIIKNQNQIIKKIYIFKALNTEETLYKLGKSKNIRKRLNSHNSALANDLILVHEFETDNMHRVEQCIKGLMRIAQYRKYQTCYKKSFWFFIIKSINRYN